MLLEEQLKLIIQNLENEDARWDAILELKLLQDPQLFNLILDQMDHPNWVVRWCLAEKLGDMGDTRAIIPLVRCLKDTDFHVRKNAYKALEKFGTHSVGVLVNLFAHPDPEMRKVVLQLITRLGEAAVPELERCLANASWVVGNRIIHTIWTIGGDRAEDALIRALPYKDVQKNVVIMLGEMKSRKAIPHLLKAYDTPSLRRMVMKAFSVMGTKVVFPVLVSLVGGAAGRLTLRAETIIVKIGEPILPYLFTALKQPGAPKSKLVWMIQKIGTPSGKDMLKQLATQDSEIAQLCRQAQTSGSDGVGVKKRSGILGHLGF